MDDDCDTACDDGFTCCAGGTTPCSALGYVSGKATCNAGCSAWNTASCGNCGNGRIDAPEVCDGGALGGNDCTTVAGGFTGGTLRCTSSCTFDTSSCTTASFDPSGIYVVSAAPSYRCAYGLVNFNIGTMTFADGGTMLVVNGAPCSMTGLSARTSRNINVTCTLTGDCDETYSLTETFSTDTTWSGTFSVGEDLVMIGNHTCYPGRRTPPVTECDGRA